MLGRYERGMVKGRDSIEPGADREFGQFVYLIVQEAFLAWTCIWICIGACWTGDVYMYFL